MRLALGPRRLFFPHSPFFPKVSGPVMDVSFVAGGIMAGLPLWGGGAGHTTAVSLEVIAA